MLGFCSIAQVPLATIPAGVVPPPPVVVVVDTHDGDYLGKRLRKEREESEARRRKVLALFEQIVEGREPAFEPVLDVVEEVGIESKADILDAPALDLNRILAGLERAMDLQRRMAIEADDEEVMLLL